MTFVVGARYNKCDWCGKTFMVSPSSQKAYCGCEEEYDDVL